MTVGYVPTLYVPPSAAASGGAPAAHAPTHEAGGSDPVTVDALQTSGGALVGDVLTADGVGGAAFAAPAGGGGASPVMFGAVNIFASTTTRYLNPWSPAAFFAPTSPAQWRVPRAGTLQNMRVHMNNPAGNGNPIVYTLRVNGVASILTASLNSDLADATDLANSVVVVAGDLLDLEVTKAASVGSGPDDVCVSMELA